jgi:phosphoribosylformylglycinamidine synthase
MKFKALVLIRLRASVSDAAGNAVKANVSRVCDIKEVSSLRLGKCIDMEFEAPDREFAEKELFQACDLMFANTVIEDWSYEIEEVSV